MLMTEEQAKKVACHRTIMLDFTDQDCAMIWQPCIASGCMAWRWAVAMYFTPHADQTDKPKVEVRTYPTNELCRTRYDELADMCDSGMVGGYCGLAGKPD